MSANPRPATKGLQIVIAVTTIAAHRIRRIATALSARAKPDARAKTAHGFLDEKNPAVRENANGHDNVGRLHWGSGR